MSFEQMTPGDYDTTTLRENVNELMLVAQELDKSKVDAEPVPSNVVNYYVSAGQSLSIGHTDLANSPINTGELAGVYLYNGVPAIAPGSAEAIDSADVASLVPFTQPTRETHIYSMLEYLSSKVGGTWIVAPQGRGGQKLTELNRGTEPYQNGVVMHSGAAAAAASLGKVLKMPFLTFIQGESDVVSDLLSYEQEIKAYYSDMVELHSDLSGQVPPMFTTQIGTSGSIAFAANELDIANRHANIYCAGPNWPIARLHNSSAVDYTHLSPEGYTILGRMLGSAVYSVVEQKNTDYRPMQPDSIKVSNDVASIDFHTPAGEVVIDTTTFPAAPSLGIQYRLGTTIALQADSWSLVGNRLTMQFGNESQPLVVGGVISGGNTLVDHSSTDDIAVPLINLRTSKSMIPGWEDWCCQFSVEVTKEMGAIDPETDNIWTYGSPTIDSVDSFATVLGTSSCYFLEGATYRVQYDSCDIDAGSARLWVGDANHTLVAGGADVVLTRGASKRLRVQTGNGGFTGKIHNLRITKES